MSFFHALMGAGGKATEVVNPLTPAAGTYSRSDPNETVGATVLTVKSDGTITINTGSGNYGLGDFVSSPTNGMWADPPSAGFGANYWVRFTRTQFSYDDNINGVCTPTTGWLQLNTDRWVSCEGYGDASTGINQATYTVEISSNSSGTVIVSSRTGIILYNEQYT